MRRKNRVAQPVGPQRVLKEHNRFDHADQVGGCSTRRPAEGTERFPRKRRDRLKVVAQPVGPQRVLKER